MKRKSKKMIAVEQAYDGQQLEVLLPRLINQYGQIATAEEIGVSRATLHYWLLSLGLRVESRVLQRNEKLVVQSGTNPEV